MFSQAFTPLRHPPQADTPQVDTAPSLGRHSQPRQTHPLGRHPLQTATAGDGTYPTRMHSCLHMFALEIKVKVYKIYTVFQIYFEHIRCCLCVVV